MVWTRRGPGGAVRRAFVRSRCSEQWADSAGWLWTAGVTAPAAILFAGAVTIVAAGYVAASRQDIDGTTEVAALVVLAAGVIAGTGSVRLASGIIALVTLLLVEKSRLHSLVQRIDDVGLRSGVRFAVMALVVLPLLPEGPYGPLGGVRPRELWALVLFFSGLSFAGYVARRLVGPGHGYFVTGLLGGMVSSTNVTFTFARTSRTDLAMDRALAFGAVAANAMLYPRVIVATAILNSAVVPPLVPYLAAPALVAALMAVVGALRSTPAEGAPDVSLDESAATRWGPSDGRSISSGADGCAHRPRVVGGVRCAHIRSSPGAHGCGRAHGVDGERSGADQSRRRLPRPPSPLAYWRTRE